jgi:hypothetical protein
VEETNQCAVKFIWFSLLLALIATGCVSKSEARRREQAAFIAGRNSVQHELAAGVTVVGPVVHPQVPWVEGLTLAQAIATAHYLDSRDPKTITITRQGEQATVDPKDLVNGTVVPLEPGDVIEIR